MSTNKVTEELYLAIVHEIARLSMIIFKGVPPVEAKGLAMFINHLTAILGGSMDIGDFHEEISNQSDTVREYYYKLLYLVK
jgi:hypothetical protein